MKRIYADVDLDTYPVIMRAVEFDPKTKVGLYIYLFKLNGLYIWYYEDNEQYHREGKSTIKEAIICAKRIAKRKGCRINDFSKCSYSIQK